ncbi:MAG: hypothetical protein PVH58_17180, partial [Desulfobacterales bacterium]
ICNLVLVSWNLNYLRVGIYKIRLRKKEFNMSFIPHEDTKALRMIMKFKLLSKRGGFIEF